MFPFHLSTIRSVIGPKKETDALATFMSRTLSKTTY
jgi:hypothetical protein